MLKYKIPQIVTLTQIIPAKNLLSRFIRSFLWYKHKKETWDLLNILSALEVSPYQLHK